MNTELRNEIILKILSDYLNNHSDFITEKMVNDLEKEFYYSKLRDFEFLLNKGISGDKSSLINTMKTILYSTKENEVTIDQYGNPSINN